MKIQLFFIIFFSIISSELTAQSKLRESRNSSYCTYIYRLNPQQTKSYHQRHFEFINDLTNPIDSFITDSARYKKNLPYGNYLKVYILQNKLHHNLIENHNAFLDLFKNTDGLTFSIYDVEGKFINHAQVYVNGIKIKPDAESGVYRKKTFSKNSILQVHYEGVANFFCLSKKKKLNKYNKKLNWRNTWSYLKNRSPVRWVYDKATYFFPNKNYTNPGYIAFNKPIYKPGDTVRFKTFLFGKRNHKPISKRTLYPVLQSGNKIINLPELNPYRKGAYESEVVLHDSMQLRLDNYVTLRIKDKKGDRKGKIKISNGFRYEDYELKSISFAMRTDKYLFSLSSQLAIYFKATDENELAVPDGRIILNVVTNHVNTYIDSVSFIADTLFSKEIRLDPIGETKFILPDSIMPNANLSIRLDAKFLNSNNEKQTASKIVTYSADQDEIRHELRKDSLFLDYRKGKNSIKKDVKLSAINTDGDTLFHKRLTLPGHTIISPSVKRYIILDEKREDVIIVNDYKEEINVFGDRTKDSVFVSVNNPRNLFFSYSLYSGSRLIKQGSGRTMKYAAAFKNNNILTCIINYLWAGESKIIEQSLVLNKRILNLTVDHPTDVYPGKESEITIRATNYKGKAVQDADITAYAITSKFKNNGIKVPHFEKGVKGRKIKKGIEQNKATSGLLKLKWEKWGKALGLDSIAYFRFTHPKDTIQFYEKTQDASTQIAPFIVNKGEILPVHFLYINEFPVFSNQSDLESRYSFKLTNENYYQIKIRTQTEEITLRDIEVKQGYKLTLSINTDEKSNKLISKIKLPDTLTKAETKRLTPYFFRIQDNFVNNLAFLKQEDYLYLLKRKNDNLYSWNHQNYHNGLLVGPLKNQNTTLCLTNKNLERHFTAEGGYSFEFKPDIVKQKSLNTPYAFSTRLIDNLFYGHYNDLALRQADIDSIWNTYIDLKANTQSWFNINEGRQKSAGHLFINPVLDNGYKKLIIRNIIVFSEDNPNFVKILPGNKTQSYNYAQGKYRVMILLSENRYQIFNDLIIKSSGINYYKLNIDNPLKNEDTEQQIWETIKQRIIENNYNKVNAKDDLIQSFNNKYLDVSSFKNLVKGTIINKDGEALPGVSIRVKGTSHTSFTDLGGNFSISTPLHGELIITYIGFQTEEINIVSGNTYTIRLIESPALLEEVVVVGYGSVNKSDLTGSVSSVMVGSAAGVNVMVRGNSTVAKTAPLIILNGVPFNGSMSDIDPASIKELNILKDNEAIAIYGSRAAGGVIIINSTGGINSKGKNKEADIINFMETSNSLRKNFSDYAYWQPALNTDKNGEVKFSVKFPNDITNWSAFVAGVGPKKLTGTANQNIRSFKTLSANVALPQFSVDGDHFNLLGKLLSYTPFEVKVQRQFKLNNKIISNDKLQFKNSLIDTFKVNVSSLDSISVEYTIRQEKGYFDGELRKIPVFRAGTKETLGAFHALYGDTTVHLSFNKQFGTVKFNAVASLLPVLEEELVALRNYEYYCNEQLASKLVGLLTERKIRQYQKEIFKYDKLIKELIKKLIDNQQKDGIWGWWPNSSEEYWISSHVVNALLQAEQAGFAVTLDRQKTIDRLLLALNSTKYNDHILVLDILNRLGAKIDYVTHLKTIEKNFDNTTTLYNRLRFYIVKRELGKTINVDSILKTGRKTMLGNIYFGEVNQEFFDNAIQNSILVYTLLKTHDKYQETLLSIRNFLLEQRSTGYWRNTYESALILNTILPDILKEDKKNVQPSLELTGAINQKINNFPFSIDLDGSNRLIVNKTGQLPVYITAFQEFWNNSPQKNSQDFTVTSYFKSKGNTVQHLKAGEEVELIVEVTPRADADYVMVEIPIPAGCSYDGKSQNRWSGIEAHREFFKNKVSIFCNTLKPIKHQFSVKLMPRFNGTYILNPVKTEMMYFPTFNGREEMKSVKIE